MADEADEAEFSHFLLYHKSQLESSGIPQLHWRALHRKRQNEIYDAGHYFTMMQEEEDSTWRVLVSAEDGLSASDPNSLFLVDHAWTYTVEHARSQLETVPGLLDRMALLMGVNRASSDDSDDETAANKTEEMSQDHLIEQVLEEMWRFNNTYKLRMMVFSDGNEFQVGRADAQEHIPLFYIMDEFGSRIQHSDEPTLMMKLFYYVPMKLSFSVIWPLRDLQCGGKYNVAQFISRQASPL